MSHIATDDFWDCYEKLPKQIQELADKNYDILKKDRKILNTPLYILRKLESYGR